MAEAGTARARLTTRRPGRPRPGADVEEAAGLVFGRRGRKEEQEAAKEAERRALFAELAKRPDTVCPFLGMVDARTEYTDGVSDRHRCFAFGDPAELSAEQQTRVCLQRGYGNCPRYLRGVLVIPTEELEALRRPPPPIQPRTAAAAEPARQPRRIPAALIGVLGVVVLLAAIGGAAFWYLGNQVSSSAQTATLPGGTDLKAELVSLSPPNGDSQNLHATASIGAAQAAANTTLIYVFDLSASTLDTGACGGDRNHDGRADTSLDCEIAAATALNAQAVENGTVGEVGLIGFAAGAITADLGSADGPQTLVAPDADADANGTPDVVQAMQSAFTGTQHQPIGFRTFSRVTAENTTTAFSAGIQAACDALADTDNPNRLVVFLSDGANRGGQPVDGVLPCDPSVVFQTFAAGQQASCEQASELGGLATISQLSDGSCTPVSDLTKLPDILQAVVVPQITRVELSVDGGKPIELGDSVSHVLPVPGPAEIQVDHDIAALGEGSHELCITVFASDAGGTGSVKSCSPAKAGGGPLTSD